MRSSFFYDTWAFAALAYRRDAGHEIAVELDFSLERAGFSPVTTDYVVDETITLLQSSAGSRVSLAFLDDIRDRIASSELELVELTRARRDHAVEVFRRLAPSEPRLSFTDATSFTVMGEFGIELAFTADRHFHRAGGGIAPLVERKGSRLIVRSVPGM